MYNLYKSVALLGILLLSGTAFSQEFIEGLPDDLPNAKVLFLKYEITKQASRKPTSKEEKIIYNRVSTHNKKVEKANKDLASALKSYPYEYKICTRKEVEKWGKEGYKYVLDSDMFTQMSNGFRQDKSRSVHGTQYVTTHLYNLYLTEIGTGKMYLVTNELKENYMYFPKYIINNVYMKKVKKRFK